MIKQINHIKLINQIRLINYIGQNNYVKQANYIRQINYIKQINYIRQINLSCVNCTLYTVNCTVQPEFEQHARSSTRLCKLMKLTQSIFYRIILLILISRIQNFLNLLHHSCILQYFWRKNSRYLHSLELHSVRFKMIQEPPRTSTPMSKC